jgi:hypothetical protein
MLTNSAKMTNAGTFTSTGTIIGAGTFVQTAGTSQFDSASAQREFDVDGGSLFGTGNLFGTVFVNGGYLQGGAKSVPGTLNIAGSLIQSAGGTVLELLDRNGFSSLAIDGVTQLGGMLRVATQNGFSFAAGQTYEILKVTPNELFGRFSGIQFGGQTGSGDSIDIGGGLELDVSYDIAAGAVALHVSAVPEPAESIMMLFGLAGIGAVGWRRQVAGSR